MAGYLSAAEMGEVIAHWLGLIPRDEIISEGCVGYDVSVEFETEDLDSFFYMRFQDSSFSGGMGKRPDEAVDELCLSSEVFDGMFSGELDATTGAMGLQSLQGDSNRLYLAARGGS
jgi:hypothetical protein